MNMHIEIIKLGGGVWQFAECDEAGNDYVDAYLVAGEKRALLIDALCVTDDLYKKVRAVTNLSFDAALTHGHADHAGASTPELLKNCGVHIDKKDLFLSDYLAGAKKIKPLADGQVFRLGGRELEVIAVCGHTPGSVVLLDRANRLMFSGDTIGSGNFWMQLPESLPLEEFYANLERLRKITEPLGGLTIYPGHRRQGSLLVTEQYIADVAAATRRIIEGSLKGRAKTMDYGPKKINYRLTGLRSIRGYCYDPMKIKK